MLTGEDFCFVIVPVSFLGSTLEVVIFLWSRWKGYKDLVLFCYILKEESMKKGRKEKCWVSVHCTGETELKQIIKKSKT